MDLRVSSFGMFVVDVDARDQCGLNSVDLHDFLGEQALRQSVRTLRLIRVMTVEATTRHCASRAIQSGEHTTMTVRCAMPTSPSAYLFRLTMHSEW